MDAYSRKEIGWSMASHLRTEPVLDALHMALCAREPEPAGLIHHSDGGSQYTFVKFGGRLKEAVLLPSMGSVSDAYDNALAESFIASLKRSFSTDVRGLPESNERSHLRVYRDVLQF